MASKTQEQKGLIGQLSDYALHPFKEDMSLVNWFLFTGLILLFIFVWASVLKSIKEAASVGG